MNPQNGKGSAPRKGAQDDKYRSNYDKIFGKPCPECGMKGTHKMDCGKRYE